MAPLPRSPVLHIGPLFKNRKSTFFSYNIYGFAINRICKKNSTICISRFFCGVKLLNFVEKLFFVGENKSHYEWLWAKNQCAMPSIAASFLAAKEVFWDVLLDFVGIHFCFCGISIDPDLSWRCFWRQLRAVWAISGSRHQPRIRRRSVSCDLVNVNKVYYGVSIDR